MEKIVKIISIHDKKNDYNFWMSKTPDERISAIELFRQQYLSLNKDVHKGFQRVFRIVNQKQG